MCLAIVLWLNYTAQTYTDGFHTPRHMIYGGAAGAATLLVFDDLCGWAAVALAAVDARSSSSSDGGGVAERPKRR